MEASSHPYPVNPTAALLWLPLLETPEVIGLPGLRILGWSDAVE